MSAFSTDDLRVLIRQAELDSRRFGDSHPDAYWLSVLVEEVGETASEMNDYELAPPEGKEVQAHVDAMRSELIQVAATAMRWYAALGRGGEDG